MVKCLRGPRFAFSKINVRHAIATWTSSFLQGMSSFPRIAAIFLKPGSQEAAERTTPKVNEWPRFSPLFVSRNAIHFTKWRGPLVNLFPRDLLERFFRHPRFHTKCQFLQWFGVNKASPIQGPKRHPRTNLSHIQKNTSLINRLILEKNKS